MPILSNQTVTLLYLTPANSRDVNLRHQSIREVGVYSGGYFRNQGSSLVTLYPFICEISDGTYQVRVEMDVAETGITAVNNQYLVLTWTYSGSASLDKISISSTASPGANDIILAYTTISGGNVSFDYSERTVPNTLDLHLKTEAPDAAMIANGDLMKVRVRAGRIQTAEGNVDVSEQISANSITSGGSTVYALVYIDDSGVPQITQDTSTIDYSGRRVIAELTVPPSTTTLTSSMIKDVRTFINMNILDEDNLSSNSDTAGATQQSIKAYVDATLNGSQTRVLRKYLTDSLPVITTTGSISIPHEVSSALSKILNVSVNIEDTFLGNLYVVPGSKDGDNIATGQPGFSVTYDSSNINITAGSDLSEGTYKIAIDYIL